MRHYLEHRMNRLSYWFAIGFFIVAAIRCLTGTWHEFAMWSVVMIVAMVLGTHIVLTEARDRGESNHSR
jgi:hypothetical protein